MRDARNTTPNGEDPDAVQRRFVEQMQYWTPTLSELLRRDPGFVDAFLQFARVPWKQGLVPARDKHLLLVAAHGTATSLNREALQLHMKNALAAGASERDILEVLEMVSVVGIHTCAVSLPLLKSRLPQAVDGKDVDAGSMDSRRGEIKRDFMAKRNGFWNEDFEIILRLCPDILVGYGELSSYPWRHGQLTPKLREFIYLVLDAVVTHLYGPGIQAHIDNALKLGATAEEIAEVLALTSTFGFETFSVGLEALDAAVADHGKR